MAARRPVMKFGGVTMQGLQRFGPNEDDVMARAKEFTSLNELYRFLAEKRNEARTRRLHEVAEEFILPHYSTDSVPVIVVSAFDWATDKLVELATDISQDPDPREYARLVMSGELRANAALAMMLQEMGLKARSLTGREAGIVTDKRPVDALVEHVEREHVESLVNQGIIPVVAGFQGYYRDDSSGRDEVSILGRGGSNLTAVALAHALGETSCIMFTNVDGIYDRDPNKFDGAIKLEEITADELFTWDPFPQVIQKEAVIYGVQEGIDVWIRDGFRAEVPGTLIRCRK
jgi:aspartate kinase